MLPRPGPSLLLFVLLTAAAGCGADTGNGTAPDGVNRIRIGIVGKSQSNPVFQAAHVGARAAEKAWHRPGAELVVDVLTPPDEDPQRQAEAVEQLARSGAAGIAVACSDANTLRPAINKAVELGAVVMCFDSDSPSSARLCYYGTDDMDCGRQVMAELARVMDGRGTIAVLAGNQAAPNLQNRLKGVLDELKKHPGMKLLDDGVFYHPETPEQAAEAVNRAQTTNPGIEGWAFIGGWPLYTRDSLKWEPGSVKVVSVDALPAQLTYLESGHVETLLAQDCWSWGYRAVEILTAKAVDGKDPEDTRLIAPLTRVTKEDVAEYRRNWETWLGD